MSKLVDDFTAKDLLYGMQHDRAQYLGELDRKFKGGDHTIDRLTKAYNIEKGFKKGWNKDELVAHTDPDAHLPQDAQAFYEFARNSRFAPKLAGTGISHKTKSGIVKGRPPTEPYLRTKCKAGIEFVIGRGFTVRFVIDSLTEDILTNIFNKEFEQPWYTGAELRYIYKNRERLRERVVFYFNGESCEPPWVKYPKCTIRGA